MLSIPYPRGILGAEVGDVSDYRPGVVPGKVRLYLYVAEEVATALRIEAAVTRESQSEIAEAAIRRELERRRAEREARGHAPAR